jgi:hypothetical protein
MRLRTVAPALSDALQAIDINPVIPRAVAVHALVIPTP